MAAIRRAADRPTQSILVAPQSRGGAAHQLLGARRAAGALGAAARADHRPARRPPRGAAVRGGAADRARRRAPRPREELDQARASCCERGIARARGRASPRPTPATTCAARRPRRESTCCCSTGGGRCSATACRAATVGTVLRRGAVRRRACSSRARAEVAPGPDAPMIVPFGGADHDWAALELGAWLAAATRRAAAAARRGGTARGRPRREPPARQRVAARPAVRRHHGRAGPRRARSRRAPRRRRPARGCS